MSQGSQKLTIAKLGENNYNAWSIRMKAYLQADNLWVHIEPQVKQEGAEDLQGLQGEALESKQQQIAKETELQARQKSRAFFCIATTVEDDQMMFIDDTTDPQEAWIRLKQHHQKVGAQTVQLKRIEILNQSLGQHN
jgi:hypothetical protein